ncbi:hypothetical protein RBB50_003190 [Rhinocladiella similis]
MASLPRFSVSSFKSLFLDAFTGSEAVFEATLSKYFSPDYIQVTDGHSSTYGEFKEHMKKIRSMTRSMDVDVKLLVQDENKIADRHVVKIEKTDGSRVELDVLLIGERDDQGRMLRVWETTRQVAGDVDGADLGRIR